MIKIPGQGPHVPPPIPPKEGKKAEEVQSEVRRPAPPPPKEGSKGPSFDTHAIAVRMAAFAHEAKEKELSFNEIIQKAIDETGMMNPQAALEEANRKLQKEIDDILEEIKANKELMEEAESWKEFAEMLEKELSEEQVTGFLDTLKQSLRSI